jgi:hypothetical protein
MSRLLSSLRFRYGRWRGIRAASRGLHSPTQQERTLIDDLRERCRALPVEPTEGRTPNEADWARAMNRLRELTLRADPRAFLRWDVIIARMAQSAPAITEVELAALKALPDWDSRWRPAIAEIPVGRPSPYDGHAASSEPLIQAAFTLARLEAMTGRRVDAWDVVVELGGGYGNMCRLMHMLGFKGRYVIFDLAPFTLLQRFYLRSAGVLREDENRVVLTSDFAGLEAAVASIAPDAWATFLACWSLSETSLALREKVRPLVDRIGRYGIAYQEQYGEMDNVDYFSNRWLSGPRRTERIAHRPGDHLLVGESR